MSFNTLSEEGIGNIRLQSLPGEEDSSGWQSGEDGEGLLAHPEFDAPDSRKVSLGKTERLDLLVNSDESRGARAELSEKYKQVLSERQEIRRKNTFLQKKMVEFFKKRKMDHVLKEDPKGLDLESKYLKRLFELQNYKKHVESSREEMAHKYRQLESETLQLESQIKENLDAFLKRQQKLAATLKLKTNKKIGSKVISNFIEKQAMNAEEITRQRILEIREKRQVDDKQATATKLESLENGMRRADYQLLQFQHEKIAKQLESKEKEVHLSAEKVRERVHQMRINQLLSQQAQGGLDSEKQRLDEAQQLINKIKTRLQATKKRLSSLRETLKNVEEKSTMLTDKLLLKDYDDTLKLIEQEWSLLDHLQNTLTGQLRAGQRRQNNTPEIYKPVAADWLATE